MGLDHVSPELLEWIDAVHPPFRRKIDPDDPAHAPDIPAFLAMLEQKRAGWPPAPGPEPEPPPAGQVLALPACADRGQLLERGRACGCDDRWWCLRYQRLVATGECVACVAGRPPE